MTNESIIMNAAVSDGMPERLSAFIVAQSKHETGNYSHRFFKTGKNAFGYAYVKGSKWQLPKGGSLADNGIPIAQYTSVENSVHELTSWIKRRQREGKFPKDLTTITTPLQYATLLKKSGYYGDTLQNYVKGLTNALTSIPSVVYKVARVTPIFSIVLIVSVLFIVYQLTIKK